MEFDKKKTDLSIYLQAINNHAILSRTNASGLITYVNDKFCQASGFEREELLNNSHRLINSGFHSQDFFLEMWRTLNKGEVWRGEIKNRNKEDQYYWVESTITPISDQFGTIIELLSVSTEITQHKSDKMLLNNIQSLAKIGGWELDIKTGQMCWTDESYYIHGLTPGESAAKDNILSQYKEIDRKRIKERIKKSIQRPSSFSDVFEFKTKQGNYIWIKNSGRPVVDRNGALIKLRGTFQDITAQTIKEKELREQKKIAVHNAKLASIGELAAGVGHEINNPLTIIRGHTNSLLDKKLQQNAPDIKDIYDTVFKVKTAAQRITKVVEGLRNFSRNDQAEFEPFDPIEALLETIQMLFEIYKNEGVHIELDQSFEINQLSIIGHRGKFQQIIINLLSNAKDSMENRKDRIIKIKLYEEYTGTLSIKLLDTGKGIPAHLVTKIFEPFFTTKDINKGTGIGLSLVHSFINEIAGKIEIIKSNSDGTELVIQLPLASPERNLKTSEVFQSKSKNHLLKGEILLVEDEESIREILSEILEDFGFNVSTASNGFEAYALAKQNDFDIIITDIQMPKMTGTDLIAKIHNNLDRIPKFIIITGAINNDSSNKIANLVSGYLNKPFENDQIFELLKGLTTEKSISLVSTSA